MCRHPTHAWSGDGLDQDCESHPQSSLHIIPPSPQKPKYDTSEPENLSFHPNPKANATGTWATPIMPKKSWGFRMLGLGSWMLQCKSA